LPDALDVSRVVEVTSLRPRFRPSLRASLVVTAVVIATLLSLIGFSIRAPEAVLGVAFARACATETAVTERSHPRLRVDREDIHLDDVGALPVSVQSTKGFVFQPEDRMSDPDRGALALASTEARSWPLLPAKDTPGLPRLPSGPPTRERARLMVFLN
jgi:hypothetical protein